MVYKYIKKNNSFFYLMIPFKNKGSILYDSLHDQIHPIGRTRNDVTYETLYGYMNCLQVLKNKKL